MFIHSLLNGTFQLLNAPASQQLCLTAVWCFAGTEGFISWWLDLKMMPMSLLLLLLLMTERPYPDCFAHLHWAKKNVRPLLYKQISILISLLLSELSVKKCEFLSKKSEYHTFLPMKIFLSFPVRGNINDLADNTVYSGSRWQLVRTGASCLTRFFVLFFPLSHLWE